MISPALPAQPDAFHARELVEVVLIAPCGGADSGAGGIVKPTDASLGTWPNLSVG
ncbi:hypothetical protein ABIB73_000246 [Bradyrhizobium sp. F1.4.3]